MLEDTKIVPESFRGFQNSSFCVEMVHGDLLILFWNVIPHPFVYIVYVYKISRSPWAIEQKIYAVCPESFRGSQKVPEGIRESKTLWDSQRVFDFKF